MAQPTLNSIMNAHNQAEEDELLVWEPSENMNETINSLEIFRTLYSDDEQRKLTAKEIRLSLKNFDDWLHSSIETLIMQEKEKEIESFN